VKPPEELALDKPRRWKGIIKMDIKEKGYGDGK
jgi:hypothetical protein